LKVRGIAGKRGLSILFRKVGIVKKNGIMMVDFAV
jgi:multidrug efflux pump subunit AcrB